MASVTQASEQVQEAETHLLPSQASQYDPVATPISRVISRPATGDELTETVKVSGVTGYRVALVDPTVPNEIGTHNVRAIVTYADESVDNVTIQYTITPDIDAARQAVREAQQLAQELTQAIRDTNSVISSEKHAELLQKKQAAEEAKDRARQAISAIPDRFTEKQGLQTDWRAITVPAIPFVNDENNNGRADDEDVQTAQAAIEHAKQAEERLKKRISEAQPAISSNEKRTIEHAKWATDVARQRASDALEQVPTTKSQYGTLTEQLSLLGQVAIPEVNDENSNEIPDAQDVTNVSAAG